MTLLSFWFRARSRRGHGVHSPLLYSFCREVLCSPLPGRGGALVDRVGASARVWLSGYAARALPAGAAPWVRVCVAPFGVEERGVTVVDLYCWRVEIGGAPMVPQCLRVRPPIGWLLAGWVGR